MGNVKLSEVVRQSALLTPEKDDFWPIPDQYIGLEMELEHFSGRELDNHRMAGSPFWVEHQDGSLRNGIEMVLSQALMGTTLREAISYFFRTFTKYTPTPRTSIHVHVNMRQDNETVEGLRNMVALYYMYEDAFFHIADQNRKWCAYCNAFEDTPPAILEAFMNDRLTAPHLVDALQRSAMHNNNRYYGLNLNALSKFGTLEFRHFPLVTDEQRLIDWLKLIMELKAAANRMAEEGHTPWSLFVTPDDIGKLNEYMPKFGNILMGYVQPSRAFHRMISVRNLGAERVNDSYAEVEKNAAFKIFQEHMEKSGKVVKAKPKRSSKKPSSLAEATLQTYQQMMRDGIVLTRDQLRHRDRLALQVDIQRVEERMQEREQQAADDIAPPAGAVRGGANLLTQAQWLDLDQIVRRDPPIPEDLRVVRVRREQDLENGNQQMNNDNEETL